MNKYVVYLEWPIQCFRVDAEALAALRGLVPPDSRVVRARDDAEFLRELPDATHAIVWHFRPEWFALAQQLRVLATPSAGRELLPLEGPEGVKIHFGGFHGAAIAESVLGYMLAWCRGVLRRPGKKVWERSELGDKCYRLQGTKAVILGYGKIGKAVGNLLGKLEVRVFGIGRSNFETLRTEVSDADWLVCVLPSDTGTDRLVDADVIAALPERCVIVNVGRGNCMDEAALKEALQSGKVAGAILDVIGREPPQAGDTLVGGDVPNLTIMSHTSAFYPEYVKDCFRELAAEELLK